MTALISCSTKCDEGSTIKKLLYYGTQSRLKYIDICFCSSCNFGDSFALVLEKMKRFFKILFSFFRCTWDYHHSLPPESFQRPPGGGIAHFESTDTISYNDFWPRVYEEMGSFWFIPENGVGTVNGRWATKRRKSSGKQT